MVLNYQNIGTRTIPGFPTNRSLNQESLPADTSVEGACIEARLSPTVMSPQEKAAFPEYAARNANIYLALRNRILMLWFINPQREVTVEDAAKIMEREELMNSELLAGIWFFLSRRGIINHGVFEVKGSDHAKHTNVKGKKILVVGGGISGIACANHLKYLGFEVKVVEAMERFGGRVLSLRMKNGRGEAATADLGAMIVTGLPGNPINTLSKQFKIDLKKIKNECPLYVDGKEITKAIDTKIETVFNKILEAVAKVKKSDKLKDRDVSLGAVVEKVLENQRRACTEAYINHQKRIEKKHEHLYSLETEGSKLIMQIAETNQEIIELEQKDREATDNNTKCIYIYHINKTKVELENFIKKFREIEKKKATITDEIKQLEKNPPPAEFLNFFEYRLLYWHIANLEYANSAEINDLSLKNWDQDDAFEFPGPHFAVKDGYDTVIHSLVDHAKGVPPPGMPKKNGENSGHGQTKAVEFQWGHSVRKIEMKTNKTAVTLRDLSKEKQGQENTNQEGEDDADTTEEFDAVVCTVPLGVLKAEKIDFIPPLPEFKKASIERLGFGNLNKIVMHFEDRFWDDRVDMFGTIGPTPNSRGEFYMFWSLNKKDPVLVGMFAGSSADIAETVCKDVVIRRAMMLLKEIFGQGKVTFTKLKRSEVTGWKRNPFIRGAYSYIKVGASGRDYDMLSLPVENENTGIFFAGEHTMRKYPATVHGAYLSGLREAGRIADKFGKAFYRTNTSEKDDT
ncbi:Oidioi.mRNA.OKI2018_I69.chr1.g1743.t1.cds [Oikopleura dioica]|uniref:Oidioi.mRNA.OKI2018_I69.chr1.g1743.t1.cds n=1 Tax=Oikopleura dioica TaxID=34765 RepID=A0ABN7ST34_OIKDI|nr:Oidioi.mRNA.OKI2018_I69.chr1.g1743.t1.cds [Oikopleura dioica]